MEKIKKEAKITRVFGLIFFIIGLVFTVIFAAMGIASIFLDVSETFPLNIGQLTLMLDVTGVAEKDVRIADCLYNLKLALMFALLGTVSMVFRMISGCIVNNGPFGEKTVKTITIGILVAVIGIFGFVVVSRMIDMQLYSLLDVKKAVQYGTVLSCDFYTTFPFAFLYIGFGVCSTIRLYLEYGALLQKQSDETL